MRIDARSGVRGMLIDLDQGRRIPGVRWADIETGEYEAFKVGPDGKPVVPTVTYRGRGRLRFLPTKNIAREEEEGERRTTAQRIVVPLFSDRCDHYACNRLADWAVSDEIALPPLVKNGRRYQRARLVDRRYYCSWHYEPPRLLDDNGEIISTWDEAGGVRPQ